MSECIHDPTPRPGRVCSCPACREARMEAFLPIFRQCVRCAGRCAIVHGQVSCEKGDYDCPVIDLWYAVRNRHIEPEKVTDAYVELVAKREIKPPRRYRRVAPGAVGTSTKLVPDPRKDRREAPDSL